jgi:uroporphyrinogen III methyltransferase / synthase
VTLKLTYAQWRDSNGTDTRRATDVTVYLVGAGPGDPKLLTIRGAELLAIAEVVVYDRLAHPSLLDLAPTAAERIAVGKAPGRVVMQQDGINELLVERGNRGQCVVRLKGGDPFVFGRGGEEAASLHAAGVPYEIVPGVSSAIAAPAYAGIPVTLRQVALSVTVVTGHEDPSGPNAVKWESLAQVGGTIVILMGAKRIAYIAGRLLGGGLPTDTPVVAVVDGTTSDQTTIRTTLGELGTMSIPTPATIVVGQVVAHTTPWFNLSN